MEISVNNSHVMLNEKKKSTFEILFYQVFVVVVVCVCVNQGSNWIEYVLVFLVGNSWILEKLMSK